MIIKTLLLIAFLFFLIILFFGLRKSSYTGPVSDHFDGKHFFYPNSKQPSFFDVIKWMLTRESAAWPKNYPVKQTKPAKTSEKLKVTFINHATVLLQWQGVNILTDPIWSERATPFSWFGPKRVHEPGVDFANLPPIDLVVISHGHYDHLDLPTLKQLNEKDFPLFLTGLGNKKLLQDHGIQNVKELDWWQSLIFKKLAITFAPARHFSARWPWDKNETLFGSFIISSEDKHLYFAGDTAYGPHFKEIQRRFGNMQLALLPIGAFEPRWFMQYNHMSPIEALQAHDDLKAEISIGIHFGTFQLSDEAIDVPVNLINENRENRQFLLLAPGETIKLN